MAKSRQADREKYVALDTAAAALTFLGVLAAVVGVFLAVVDEDTRLLGGLALVGGLQLLVGGLILRGLHAIARNTANLNRLGQASSAAEKSSAG